VPSSPARTAPSALIAIKVIDQQDLHLLSHNCLFLVLAWRGRTGQGSGVFQSYPVLSGMWGNGTKSRC
jgi:hypothetical protein